MKIPLAFCFLPWLLIAKIDCLYNQHRQIEEIDLHAYGKIVYIYDEKAFLKKVERRDENNKLLYETEYFYREDGSLKLEKLIGNLGIIDYFSDKTLSPYHSESFDCKTNTHSIDDITISYQLPKSDNRSFSSINIEFNEAHQIIKASNNKTHVEFTYDSNGLRQSKMRSDDDKMTFEFYASVNREEIAIFDEEGHLIELKVPGLPLFPGLSKPCAIEIDNKVYAPIIDYHHNIYALVDIETKLSYKTLIDPFGKNLVPSLLSRFCYRGKIYDPDLDLVFFGYRYYNIHTGLWMSEDPFGPLQSENLYNYCLNEPWKYLDPDGRFCVVIPIIGGLTFSEVVKDIVLGAAISISYDYVVPEISLWLKKLSDEKRMEEFLKIQRGEL